MFEWFKLWWRLVRHRECPRCQGTKWKDAGGMGADWAECCCCGFARGYDGYATDESGLLRSTELGKMNKEKFTEKGLTALRALGWEFMPTGPNEWEWIKFDVKGWAEARQGSEIWARDVKLVETTK